MSPDIGDRRLVVDRQPSHSINLTDEEREMMSPLRPKRRPQRILFYVFILFLALTGAAVVQAKEVNGVYVCEPDHPEGPAYTVHVEQEDLLQMPLDDILDVGEQLFIVNFNSCDGRGRPATTGGGDKREPVNQPAFLRTSAPDANSCAGCHNQPRLGGGGDFVANVFVLAQTLNPVVESVNGEFSNERNTLGMFGAGPIEMLAREMTAELWAIRDAAIAEAQASGALTAKALVAKGVDFGTILALPDGTLDTSRVEGVDLDLIVRPFHQAGRVVSLREFSNNAMNHHHGMQPEERFDLVPAKGPDFDEDSVARELTIGDLTAISLWQASLATPGRVLPTDPAELEQVNRGEELFHITGCASCHIPEMRLNSPLFVEPNPFNPDPDWKDQSLAISFDMTREGLDQRLERDGDGAIVRAYTDLKRHNLCDDPTHPDAIRHFCNENLAQGRPDQGGRPGTEFFLTRKLWDVGNSGPYGHRGDLTTITEAILMHGGEGREARDAFEALSTTDQAAIISFLKTLQVLPEGEDLVITEDELYSDATTSDATWVANLGWIVAGIALLTTVAVVRQRREATPPM